jgi:hypothetical protein
VVVAVRGFEATEIDRTQFMVTVKVTLEFVKLFIESVAVIFTV